MKIITFLTDFGIKSSYVAQMKGVAVGISDARLIDISHDIPPHNIRLGAFILKNSITFYPKDTVHVAVVDPGVGTKRRGIIINTKSQILVGPDNGLLIPAARQLGIFSVYEIKNDKYMIKPISNTFHGRDIFTPIAAHISNGISVTEIGEKIDNFVDLDFGKGKITKNMAIGNILFIDNFGNIITNINGLKIKKLLKNNKKINVSVGNNQFEMKFVKSYGHVEKYEMLIAVGSSDLVEIGINQGNAAEKLSVKEDDEVKILFN